MQLGVLLSIPFCPCLLSFMECLPQPQYLLSSTYAEPVCCFVSSALGIPVCKMVMTQEVVWTLQEVTLAQQGASHAGKAAHARRREAGPSAPANLQDAQARLAGPIPCSNTHAQPLDSFLLAMKPKLQPRLPQTACSPDPPLHAPRPPPPPPRLPASPTDSPWVTGLQRHVLLHP